MSDRRGTLVPMQKPTPEITHEGYQRHGANDRPDMQIDPALFAYVRRHILLNYVPWFAKYRPARSAVVQGAAGEGKSSMVCSSLSRLGVGVIVVNSSALAGDVESAPREYLRSVEAAVYAISEREKTPMSVLFDDADTAQIVKRENTEYTCNAQILEAFLQELGNGHHLKDYRGIPVPCLWTANDLSGVRGGANGPLLRSGRATIFTLKLSPEFKAQVVKSLFAGIDEKQIASLVKRYSDQPLSFWSDVRARVIADGVDALCKEQGMDFDAIDRVLNERPVSFDLARIRTVAAEMASTKLSSFIGRSW